MFRHASPLAPVTEERKIDTKVCAKTDALALTRCDTPYQVSVVELMPMNASLNHAVATLIPARAVSVEARSVVLRHTSAQTPVTRAKKRTRKHCTKSPVEVAFTRCVTPFHVSVVAFAATNAPLNHTDATRLNDDAETAASSIVLRHASALTPAADEKNVTTAWTPPPEDVAVTHCETPSQVSVVALVPDSALLNQEMAESANDAAASDATRVVLRHVAALTPTTDASKNVTYTSMPPPVAVAVTCCETPSHISVVAFAPTNASVNHARARRAADEAVTLALSVVLRHVSAPTSVTVELNIVV